MQNEESIFAAAVGRTTPEERAAFLDATCGGNTELRGRIEGLLWAHEHPDSFLNAPGNPSRNEGSGPFDATIDAPTASEPAGRTIGPYKLLQQIGEGGMGTVYLAEQTEPVQRQVALKLIKAGMDSRQVISRFEAERQALALMDHPNIARVLDAGTTSNGLPYFVMELVKGMRITKYCDEHQLTPRQRLELFIPVCQAVQHAHQKGIIHRDLKPSNVLIALYDGRPVPKIIDFGVAKATGQRLTDKTLFTGFGALLGTPEYMSPEQAEVNNQDIDTRSDIYSLGVLLYELLAGSPPFTKQDLEQAGMLEMLRVIREREPSKPSTRLSTADGLPTLAANRGTEPATLTKLVRGELDWIVMKALEKDRNRRYQTANGFAMDIQRYLADEQVLACPPSVGYRLRKLARRNRGALAVTGLIVLFVALLGGGAGWAVRDRAAREAATHEREAEVAREKVARRALTRERVGLALDESGKRHQEGRWKEALDAAKRAEALAAAGDGDEETHHRAQEVLRDMQMLANLEEVRVNTTKNQEGFALKEEDSGNARAFQEYGIDIDALDQREAAKRIRARSIRYELAVFLDSWSFVRRRLERTNFEEAGKDWRELLEVARAVDPDPWRDRFRAAVLADDLQSLVELAASATASSLPAETVDRLGDALINGGAYGEAAAFLKRGEQVHPQDYWINVNLARSLEALNPPRFEEAIRYYTAAVALRPEAAKSHLNLGGALMAAQKLDEAVDSYVQAVAINPRYQTHLSHALERQKKPPDEAIALYRRLLQRLPRQGALHLQLARELRKEKRFDEAVDSFRQAIQLSAQDNTYRNDNICFELGCVLYEHGQFLDAVEAFQMAIDVNPQHSSAYAQLGSALRSLEQSADAVKLPDAGGARQWDKAVARFTKAIEQSPNDANRWNERGNAYNWLGRTEQAIADYSKACELNPQEATYWRNRGVDFAVLGQYDKATGDFSRALDLHPGDAWLWFARGITRAVFGQNELALDDLSRATELNPRLAMLSTARGNVFVHLNHSEIVVEPDPRAAVYWHVRGLAYGRQGRWEQALADFEKAAELTPTSPAYRTSLGTAHAQLGQWDKATVEFERATTLAADFSLAWYLRALLELQRDDHAGYRHVCTRMLDLPEHATLGDSGYWTTWTWVLAPDAIADWTKPLKLAEDMHAAATHDDERINLIGCLLYRAGRIEEAAQRLTEAGGAFKEAPGRRTTIIYNWLFQAMAQVRLGHAAEAANWLEKAVRVIDAPSAVQDSATNPWNRRLTLDLLRREAEELLRKQRA